MTKQALKDAVQEAERFLLKAKEFRKVADTKADVPWWNSCPVESGALKRASLDLTRALAKMRKP